MLCVIAKLDDAATKILKAVQKIAYGESGSGSSLYGHITVATYMSDDEAGFISACKEYLNNVAAFDIIYDKIEVLDETSIIVAVPRRIAALELLHQYITDNFDDALDKWTKSDAWYPHTTLYYNPESDLGKICNRMTEQFAPVTAHISAIEFSRVLERGYKIVDHVNLSKEGKSMNRTNEAAVRIKDSLHLTLNIQAVRFIENPLDVPENVMHARENFGHLSLCQAFALVKRDGLTVYTDKSSEWCWAPVVALGYADCSPGTESYEIIKPLMGIADPEKADRFFTEFPRLPLGKYKGILLAPADKAEFEADVLLINCDNNYQMRTLLSAVKYRNGKMLEARLDPIDSCVHTLVASFLKKDYTIAIPDPGEQERALTGKNEIIMAVPAEKLDDLMAGFSFPGFRYNPDPDLPAEMEYDFPRPPFYNKVFALWGMEEGKEW